MNRGIDYMFLAKGELPFLLHSLKDLLKSKGMFTDKCNLDVETLIEVMPKSNFFIVDAATLLDNHTERVFLYDKCIEHNKKIILIGDDNTLADLDRVSTANVVAYTFKRPINNSEIADKLKTLIREFAMNQNKKNILVVDDSPTFLRLMSSWLENEYNVNVCPSATAAFHMIETNKPDLILLDYEMPICNGAQFLQMLRSEMNTSSIPVIFLTSKDDIDTVKALIALKPQGYLLKNQSKENTLNAISGFFIKEQMK